MAKFAKGKHALAISDRSGLAFPWREMVTEWNGQFVHYSEYERKQPQLEPSPFVSDPQGLEKARPQIAPIATPDLLPENPISETNIATTGAIYIINQPHSGILVGDVVRLMNIQTDLQGAPATGTRQVLELEATLAAGISATDTSLTLQNNIPLYTNGGFVCINKINPITGFFDNEVIKYASYNSGTKVLSGLIRGTNAPFRGKVPVNTNAGAHEIAAKVCGGRFVHSLNETTQSQAGQPSTITVANSYNLRDNDEGSLFSPLAIGNGGGLNCLAGPVNNNFNAYIGATYGGY